MTDETKLKREARSLIPPERIEQSIVFLRGEKVMLSEDLARLYDVEHRVLNQAVKRNLPRFPADFMFQLTWDEVDQLQALRVTPETSSTASSRSQSVILKRGGNVKYPPYAFTEQGVAMLSTVLNSDRAILVNIEIMRAFVKLRRMLASHADLAQKLEVIERKYDGQFKVVFDTLRQLMAPPDPPKKEMGFHTIRDSAKEQTEPSKPTASVKPPKRRRRTDA